MSYKADLSYDKTSNVRRSLIHSISKTANIKFTEVYSKSKKYVPGIGHYDVTKADKILSKPRGYK